MAPAGRKRVTSQAFVFHLITKTHFVAFHCLMDITAYLISVEITVWGNAKETHRLDINKKSRYVKKIGGNWVQVNR